MFEQRGMCLCSEMLLQCMCGYLCILGVALLYLKIDDQYNYVYIKWIHVCVLMFFLICFNIMLVNMNMGIQVLCRDSLIWPGRICDWFCRDNLIPGTWQNVWQVSYLECMAGAPGAMCIVHI